MATSEPLPGKADLTLYRGDTRVWTDVFDRDGVPVDLTGHTFLAQIRPDRDRGTVVATITVELVDAPAGIVRRTLTAEQAELLGDHGARLYWDLQSTDAAGNVRTWLAGNVKVEGDASDV